MKGLGIDFGTTNTAVAFYDDSDPKKEIISIPYHGAAALVMKKTLPSVVLFNSAGKPWLFGENALNQGKDPEKQHLLVDKIKRVIGKTYEEAKTDPLLKSIAYDLVKGDLNFVDGKPVALIKIGKEIKQFYLSEQIATIFNEARKDVVFILVGEVVKQAYLPEEIVAMILKEANNDAETYLQREKGYENLDYDYITITFPANFNQNQRPSMQNAAFLAGFPKAKLKFINEPTAAAFDAVYEGKITMYQTKRSPSDPEAMKKSTTRQKVLVLNIGSGTIDLAGVVLTKETEEDETKPKYNADTFGTGGDSMFGGTDMDIAIADWVLDKVKNDPDVNCDLFSKAGRQLLRFNAEAAKIAISEGKKPQTIVDLPTYVDKGPLLTKKDLNDIIKPIVDKCRKEFSKILADRKIQDEAYTQVVLTGGPMDMNIVKNMIIGEFLAPIYNCPVCRKQLLGNRPSKEFLTEDKGLPEDTLNTAQADAWWYTHQKGEDKTEEDCGDHLVFSDSTHYEISKKRTETEPQWRLTDKVDLQSRNHEIVEGVDPMMCVARGAAIDPLISYITVTPRVIRLLVKGENTTLPLKESLKPVIELTTHLPANVYNTWVVLPWESNIEIKMLEDTKETEYDPKSNSYYGVFTYWGHCSYALTPSKDKKNIYVGMSMGTREAPEGQRTDLFVFESESDLADWLHSPRKYKGTPLLFGRKAEQQKIENRSDGNDQEDRVWEALRAQSPSLFSLLIETYQLVISAVSLEKSGFKISEKTSGLVDKASPNFGAIYSYVDSAVNRIKELKLSDAELNQEVKAVVTTVTTCREYTELSELMRTSDWENNMAQLTITVEAVGLLVRNIGAAIDQAHKLLQRTEEIEPQDKPVIPNLINILSSDLQFFQRFVDRGESILLKSAEGASFTQTKHRLEILQNRIEYYKG
jgi:molecular chaperone DnaK (HSP70)